MARTRTTTLVLTATLGGIAVIGPVAPAATAATVTPKRVTVAADLTSTQKILYTVAPNDRVTYGFNLLEGTDARGASPVQVQMLGNVTYTKGSGPLFGTITFTAADGSTLGVRMDGSARALPNGTDAKFTAKLAVLGGTGEWLRAKGRGTFVGSRQAALGGTVRARFTIRLTNR
ncbi:MAG: hypothetical protein RL531_2007 [Actinomycetota bacterium]|jgi:hypothetical protein